MKILKSTKNSFLTMIVFVGVLSSFAHTEPTKNEKEIARDHVAAFFRCAQDELATVKAHLKEQVLDVKTVKRLQKHMRKLTVLDCIARRDSNGLAAAQKNELEFYTDNISVEVSVDCCTQTLQGRLVSFTFDAENALPFVLYHSALDLSDADNAATLAMLKVLFDKGLDAQVVGCSGYWLRNEKGADKSSSCCCDCSGDSSACCESADCASDYVGESSLVELSEYYSSKQVQKLVAQRCEKQ